MATQAEDPVESSRAPLIDHLVELRKRMTYSVIAIIITVVACYLVSQDIFDFLVEPLRKAEEARGNTDFKLIYTHLLEAFFTQLKIAFWAGFFVAFPVIASQIWMFVAPGLYKHEKKAFLPYLFVSPVLFFAGAALVYYFIFPQAWEFFASFQTKPGDPGAGLGTAANHTELLPKMGEYLSLVMKLIFAFGLAFQLPVLLTLLGRVGMTSSKGLKRFRKYAIVIIFIVAAIITPPDLVSQIGLAVPLLALYEISIFTVGMVERKREEKRRQEEKELAELFAGETDVSTFEDTDFNYGR
ncbi:MAG: twin-arginine translocase subunit TatC [Alphaproteobacteria bacterium]|nr:twin-arginine translocase subunit TatC [Alphaproteobacteria bacterium]